MKNALLGLIPILAAVMILAIVFSSYYIKYIKETNYPYYLDRRKSWLKSIILGAYLYLAALLAFWLMLDYHNP